jgi:hypothetical protein
MQTALSHLSHHKPALSETGYKTSLLRIIYTAALLIAATLLPQTLARAQVNGVGQKPYLGWSTFSQQTIIPTSIVMTQANILAQSDALRASGLEAHGFRYINLDGGWTGDADENGRTLYNKTAFPDFFGMIAHIHTNGQKFGIYMNPGVSPSVVAANPPILGTQYHMQDIIVTPPTNGNAFGGSDKIDFSKPGAQEYINSMINLYASWGVDFIKLDAVTPGSYNNDLRINNIPDVQAMSKAIALSGQPIWLTISWAIDEDYLGDWQQFSNITLNSSGGSSNLPSSITIPVHLEAGMNSIEFGNPASYPPDLDRIVIGGDGDEPLPTSTTYEGKYATLRGSASAAFCYYCSGVAKAGNIGGAGNDITFANVTVPTSGIYQMAIDYLTQGPRSFYVSVNDGPATELDLNGSSFNSQASIVVPVKLQTGTNTIRFSNPNNYAPDLDRIVIAPALASDTDFWSETTQDNRIPPLAH